MRTLLAVPVSGRGPYRGNLYLSEKEDGAGFSEHDEETLVHFASQAAIAIDNAHLHNQMRELGAARERIRIAHEMHDGLAQVLAYVNTKAQVVAEYCRQGKMDEARAHLGQLSDAARKCYGDVREQILELRTSAPSESGLLEAVREYVAKWERQAGIQVDLEAPAELTLGAEVELQLLRILQEALTNVRKHAGANRVRIALEPRGGRIHLRIVDDGEGFSPPGDGPHDGLHRPRFGLATMRERAQAVGGSLEVTAVRGEGTRVHATLPAPHTTDKEIADAAAHR